jgi:hypothetical protein
LFGSRDATAGEFVVAHIAAIQLRVAGFEDDDTPGACVDRVGVDVRPLFSGLGKSGQKRLPDIALRRVFAPHRRKIIADEFLMNLTQ